MDFGITFEKILIIAVIAAFLIGPEKLPEMSRKLAQLIKSLKAMANGAQGRLKEEMGPEYEEVDWKKLDPRQYDPRQIIRTALLDEPDVAPAPLRPAGPAPASPTLSAEAKERTRKLYVGEPVANAPFDDEAT